MKTGVLLCTFSKSPVVDVTPSPTKPSFELTLGKHAYAKVEFGSGKASLDYDRQVCKLGAPLF